jgi:hypothetical protein
METLSAGFVLSNDVTTGILRSDDSRIEIMDTIWMYGSMFFNLGDNGATITGGDGTLTLSAVTWTHINSALVGLYGTTLIDTTTTVGMEALNIKQDDADQAFINYQGTSSANLLNNISTYTTEGGTIGYVKVEINGTAYWMRACTAPTA